MRSTTRLALCAPFLSLLSSLPAQGLQLATSNVAPANNYFWSNVIFHLPTGPVTFPGHWYYGWYGSLDLGATPTSVTTQAHAMSAASFSILSGSSVDLVTTASMPSPARVSIQVQAQLTFQQTLTVALPLYDCGVDLGADGIDEFTNGPPSSAVTTLTTWCDSLGTPVRWHQHLEGFYDSGVLDATTTLSLQFDNPVQEATYGPSCAGSLGCQRGAGQFDRIFVASLPGNTTFAWLMGGDAQWNVTFPGIGCPLLVDPQFILAVPLQDGPNGRKYVDFEGTFPPIPGLTFYAQGVAVSGGAFVGTNGVRVQT
ncbi:MAG: hypothetical protein H6838_16005 [Planctomycetes bacterium]|nr:hypothetical protein [Planctomycetota bacterium]MCB9886996.1 hypothetical protein [Planctomycetota bacterium]